MRRFLILVLALLTGGVAVAAPLTAAEKTASIEYVQGLVNEDGGFRAGGLSGPSSMGATSSALRALRYLGGKPVGNPGRYLLGCSDISGGLTDGPGGPVDVRSTAMGLMVAVEIKSRLKDDVSQTLRDYFARNASTLPDIYIATAALDAAGLKTAKATEWIAAFEATRNPDGTYGKSVAENAGAVVTLLRLGAKPETEAARKALLAAQLPDGGWAATGDKSDLSTTYRVMRALFMLKARPDLDRLTRFVATCRNQDGGYAPQPGGASGGGPTYFAAIVLHWAEELSKQALRPRPELRAGPLRPLSPRPFLR
jgi:hypothetical protein